MKLREKRLTHVDLLLDPSNPRLATCFEEHQGFDPSDPVACQPLIESRFGVPPERSDVQREIERLASADHKDDDEESDDDFFSVKDLKDSMRRIGFVGIQNIIVREHPSTGKYIVLEGNRRLAAIRAVLREHQESFVGQQNYINDDAILNSLKDIKVMVFDVEGRDEATVQKEISTMLGLRHYGSQLNWELLPRAKNIFDEYMKLMDGEGFSYTSGKAAAVAATLAIKSSEVKKLLRGYRCYQQLLNADLDVKPHHFSLVLAAAETPGLTMKNHEYFEIDAKTFEVGDDTPEKFEKICQFSDRDTKGFDKIVKDPKQFRKLGQILKDSVTAAEESIRGQATALFEEVIEAQIPLEDAYTNLLAFKKRQNWVIEIRKLLDRQALEEEKGGEISTAKFIGQGQQLKLRDDLNTLLDKFKLLADLGQ